MTANLPGAAPATGIAASPGRHGRPRSAQSKRFAASVAGWLFTAPAALLFVCFVILPAIHAAYLSFFRWDGFTKATWVGISNYEEVLSDPSLSGSIINSFVLILFFSALPIALALALTAVLGRVKRRGMTFFRFVAFLPQVLPGVAVGLAWKWMYAPNGTVNQILNGIGLGSLARPWLGDFSAALPAVGLIGTWVLTGFCLVLFLSGTGRVDGDLYEAVRLDGAGAIREFVSVTLPHLRGEILVAVTISIVAALASFDLVYVSTDGSPGGTTNVPGLVVYRLFTDGEVGLACALAVVLAVLVAATVGVVRFVGRERP